MLRAMATLSNTHRVFHIVILLCLTFSVHSAYSELPSTECLRYSKSPKPAGTPCGVRGKLSKPAILQEYLIRTTTLVTSIDGLKQCRDSCFDVLAGGTTPGACGSFFYDAATYRCRLFTKPLEQMGFTQTKATSGPQYYSKSCFDAICSTSYRVLLTDDDTVEYDDTLNFIVFPFPITYYGTSYAQGFLSTNGWISFGGESPSGAGYENSLLPKYSPSSSNVIPNETLCVYWDDLKVYKPADRTDGAADQSVSYTLRGIAPKRSLTFHWRLEPSYRSSATYGLLDAEMTVYENDKAKIEVKYNDVDNSQGSSATIGMQSGKAQKFVNYLYNNAFVKPGWVLVFDTDKNTVTGV